MVGSIGRFVAAKGQKVLQLGCVETRDGMLCFWCSDKKTVASHRVEWLQRHRERERESWLKCCTLARKACDAPPVHRGGR